MKRYLPLLISLFLFGCAEKTPLPSSLPANSHYGKASQRPYKVNGKTYYPLPSSEGFVEEGVASWYGPGFHGRRTASGEKYDMYAFTAAHKVLPLGTYVLVTNLENGRQTIVRINDRGPFVKGRIIDLSYAAARALGIHNKGTARVRIQALAEGKIQNNRLILQHPNFYKGRFYVQVGAFSRYANAVRLRERLGRRFRTVLIEPFRQRGQLLYRVRVFASYDLKVAQKILGALSKEFPNAILVAQ